MRVFMNGYPNHWVSPYTVIDYLFFWTDWSKCSRNKGLVEDKDYVDHPAWVDKLVNYLNPFCTALSAVRKAFSPTIRYVKIDRYDTWSMDDTLAHIILPMLKQLNKTKHGAPFTEDEDVPEELRSTNADPKENEWDTDSNHFKRWDYIMNEMIWAFEQKLSDDAEAQFFDHSAYEEGEGKSNHDKWFKDVSEGLSKVKYDKEGHAVWEERKKNGFRLFGKYYENLWD